MEKILIIEDNETIRLGMEKTLRKDGFEVFSAADGETGLALFDSEEPDAVISDLKMSEMDGIEVLRQIQKRKPLVPVMIITAFGTIEKAVEAMKLGAQDFITKPFSPELLRVKAQQAIRLSKLAKERERLMFENQYLKHEQSENRDILGESEAIIKVMSQIDKVAKTDSTVFIQGESGTGKEMIARAIHERSERAGGPFIKVNCSALAEGILESELFGHEKGAFTGAVRRKPGRFELADGGTLFLDEIGDIHPNIQLKLLRVLQEREFERVGGTQTLKVDVRLISATHQDVKAKVENGSFREDLYYRLVILPLFVPPLRERGDDIRLLVDAIMAKLEKRLQRGHKTFSEAALDRLCAYPWPGNVRELENILEQIYILNDINKIDVNDLPSALRPGQPVDMIKGSLGDLSLPEILEQTEKHLLEQAFEQAQGVKARMAKMLGIKPSALYYKLEKYGIDTDVHKKTD